MSDVPVDHALSLLLADDPESALRWSAAVLERDPWSASAIIVTARVLSQMGRTRAAIDGLHLAVQRSVEAGDLPLAVVAIDQLRGLGANVNDAFDTVASSFCKDSNRMHTSTQQPLRDGLDFQPLSPLLTDEPLAAKATQILLSAKHAERAPSTELAAPTPLPLFGSLPRESLRDLLEALETTFVPSGYRLLQEGKDAGAAYLVATGSLELSRRSGTEAAARPRTILGRVGAGALVGEVALMSHLPSAATVIAMTTCILLVARRAAVEPVAARHPELGIELAAFCRRHAVANLGWASTLVAAVPPAECVNLVDRLETRTFERGEKLVAHGEEAQGLHLIVSGEVAVVAREGGGRVMLATRSAGETVGEVELVLCQKANVDAIAMRPTASLLLPPEDFFALVRESPSTLHGLYAIAVRRHAELRHALESGSTIGREEWVLDDDNDDEFGSGEGALPSRMATDAATRPRATTPPALPRDAAMPTPTPPPVGYEPFNGPSRSTLGPGAGLRGDFSFGVANSTAPGRPATPTVPGGHTAYAPPAPPPASFIPPAGHEPQSMGSSPPRYSSSQFASPPSMTSSRPTGSVPPSVGPAAGPTRPQGGTGLAVAVAMAAISILVLGVVFLGKRTLEAPAQEPAAAAQQAPPSPPPAPTIVERAPSPPSVPAAAASAPVPKTEPTPTVAAAPPPPAAKPVHSVAAPPALRVAHAAPAHVNVEPNPTPAPAGASSTTAAPAVTTASASPAASSAAPDEFGGRQ
jgi:cAMP-dependent protein kinase regulator